MTWQSLVKVSLKQSLVPDALRAGLWNVHGDRGAGEADPDADNDPGDELQGKAKKVSLD